MKRKIIVALLLILTMICSLFAFTGCGDKESGEKQVPVYQGMTITNANAATMSLMSSSYRSGGIMLLNANKESNGDNGNHNGHYKGDHADRNDTIDEENPYPDNDENENIEEEIKSSLNVVGSPDTIYYAEPNQDIYINIHIDNPDSFEIMSFTLNGKKYSSYMFEEGSDMETIVLKYNVGDTAGIIEYTIDAIKYIDGTEIKDVIIDGNKTVMAGVKTQNQVAANVSNVNVGTNVLSFDVNIRDNNALIEFSKGTLKAVLYDGFSIVAEKDLAIGDNTVNFDGLKTNTIYQYAVIGYYDDLSGDGVGMNVLYKDAFYTDSVVLFDNITLGQESIGFSFLWHEDHQNKSISALKLYKGNSFVKNITASSTSINDLLSNTTYKLVAEYPDGDNTESIYIEFTTFAKATPEISVVSPTKTQTSVGFEIGETDADNVGAVTKIELVHANGTVVADSLDQRTFANLLSNNVYTVKVTYVYNLNDGEGEHTIIKECEIVTLSKTVPQVEISNVEITSFKISADCKFTDIDLVLSSYVAELYNGEELIAQNSDGSIAFEFSENAKYTIHILYTYDLNDGKGIQIAVSSQDVYTGFAVTADNRAWIGYTGEANENLVIPATFEYDGAWYRVTSIGDNAFYECKALVSVTIPSTVTSIGQQAFLYCESLTTVVIPEGVTTIGDLAFCFCGNLTDLTIPSTVGSIGWGAFKGAQMTNVVIPDGITSIPSGLFEWNESLQSITIPASVTNIGTLAFYYNKSLTTIIFNGTVEQWINIVKTDDWDELSGDYIVTCTNGIVN